MLLLYQYARKKSMNKLHVNTSSIHNTTPRLTSNGHIDLHQARKTQPNLKIKKQEHVSRTPAFVFGGISIILFLIKLFEAVPNAEHIHNAESTVVKTVAGAHVAGALVPKVSAVVGADIALEAAVMIRLEDIENTGVTVAVSVACFGEVTVFKMLYVSDMSESNPVTVLAHYVCYVVVGVCIKASGAEGDASL